MQATQTTGTGMLTATERLTLVVRLARTRGTRGVTDAQSEALLRWAHQARVQQRRLADVLAGRLIVDVDDVTGALRFFGPSAESAATGVAPLAADGCGLGSATVEAATVRRGETTPCR